MSAIPESNVVGQKGDSVGHELFIPFHFLSLPDIITALVSLTLYLTYHRLISPVHGRSSWTLTNLYQY